MRRPIALLLTTAMLLAITPLMSARAEGDPPSCDEGAKVTVTATAEANGSISPSGPQSVCPGEDLSFTINPADGYELDVLMVDDVARTESVSGDGQFMLTNIQKDQTVSVTFRSAGGGGGGGCQPGDDFTITATAGPNGSISPSGDIEKGCGDDLEFTIEPAPGYMVDELRADGLPEQVDENGNFTLSNIQRSQTVSVTFTQIVEYSVTVYDPVGGEIKVAGDTDPIPSDGSVVVKRVRGSDLGLLISLDGVDKTLTEVKVTGGGDTFDIAGGLDYDQVKDSMRIDWRVDFNAQIRFTVKTDHFGKGVYEPVAIAANPASDAAKGVVRRELAYRGIDVPVGKLTMNSFTDKKSDNDIDFKQGSAEIDGVDGNDDLNVYATTSPQSMIIKIKPNTGDESVTIATGDQGGDGAAGVEVQVELPAFSTPAQMIAFGPGGAQLVGIMSDNSELFDEFLLNGNPTRFSQKVKAKFGIARFHAGGWEFNWMPLTLIQADALVVEVTPYGRDRNGSEEALAWTYDRTPDLTNGAAEHQLFFGNDALLIGAPSGGGGGVDGVAVEVDRLRPGYEVTNIEGGLGTDPVVKVEFFSDFYDVLEVELIITPKVGTPVERTLTLRRTGVELQIHNAAEGDPGNLERNTWHGTQNGNWISLSGSKGYQVTASYHLPGFGEDPPYGLFVTRTYADGRTETAMITDPMKDPTPMAEDIFAPNGVFIYKNGSNRMANVVDYLVFSGKNRAAAPTSMSVLVLRDEPAVGTDFGGLYFGSADGVPWKK